MQTTVKAGDTNNILELYGTAALRGMFIYSKPEFINEYVTFLHESVQDEVLGDIRKHIQEELEEFEVTDEQIFNFMKIDVAIDIPII